MSYFCSRSKHVINTIRRLPVLTAIALVVLAVAVCCLIYEYMTESLSYYFTAFFFILLYSVHSRRKDYRFYLLILDRPKAVMAIEYMLVLLPLTIILLCTGKYISGVLTAVLPFLIVILPLKELGRVTALPQKLLISLHISKTHIWRSVLPPLAILSLMGYALAVCMSNQCTFLI